MWSFSLQLHENHTFQDHQLSLQNPRDVFLFVLCDPLWPLWQATPSSFMKVPPSLVLITVPSLYFPPSSLPAHHIYELLSSYSFFSTYPWYLLLAIHWSYSLCYLTFSTVRPVYPTTDSHFLLRHCPSQKADCPKQKSNHQLPPFFSHPFPSDPLSPWKHHYNAKIHSHSPYSISQQI